MPVPPKKVQRNARQALEERKLYRGVKSKPTTSVGLSMARKLARGKDLSFQELKKMSEYFPRHQYDNLTWERDSKGRLGRGMVSWLMWGGDEGWDWSERQMERYADF